MRRASRELYEIRDYGDFPAESADVAGASSSAIPGPEHVNRGRMAVVATRLGVVAALLAVVAVTALVVRGREAPRPTPAPPPVSVAHTPAVPERSGRTLPRDRTRSSARTGSRERP